MPSVRDMAAAFSSGSSSFETWNKSRDEDETSSEPEPLRYVRQGEYDTDYDPMEMRRREAESGENDMIPSFFDADGARSFFRVFDDGTVLSTSLSQSPTEYTRGTAPSAISSRDGRSHVSQTFETSPTSRAGSAVSSQSSPARNKYFGNITGHSPSRAIRRPAASRQTYDDGSEHWSGIDNAENPFEADSPTVSTMSQWSSPSRSKTYQNQNMRSSPTKSRQKPWQSPARSSTRTGASPGRQKYDEGPEYLPDNSILETSCETTDSKSRFLDTSYEIAPSRITLQEEYSSTEESSSDQPRDCRQPSSSRFLDDSHETSESRVTRSSLDTSYETIESGALRLPALQEYPSIDERSSRAPDQHHNNHLTSFFARETTEEASRSSSRKSRPTTASPRSRSSRSTSASPRARTSPRGPPARSSSQHHSSRACPAPEHREGSFRSHASSVSRKSSPSNQVSERTSSTTPEFSNRSSPTRPTSNTSRNRNPNTQRNNEDGSKASKRPSSTRPDASLPSVVAEEASWASERSGKLSLHDLCSDARSQEDAAWGNALHLLSTQPHLANVTDRSGWSALHLSCLASFAPPEFFIRGLLVAAPESAQVVDNRGRLPLHILAATSADPSTMQLLVDGYPEALTDYDDKGMLPLHVMLANNSVRLTIYQLRILLGQTITKNTTGKKAKVSSRRGEHLDLSFEEVNKLVSKDDQHEKHVLASYPESIRVSFKRLIQWKRKRKKLDGVNEEGTEVRMDEKQGSQGVNPAALPDSQSGQLALHFAVMRNPVKPTSDESDTEDDDVLANSAMVPPASSAEVLRVIIAAHPASLIIRENKGRTPLLLALCGKDSLPNSDMVELLLGRTTAGFETPPKWAGDVELHNTYDNRFTNPAMMASHDLQQLPLHVAAEQMTSNLEALTAIYQAYPGAVHVQDVRGRSPLHLALSNFQQVQPHPAALALLLSDRAARTKDDGGMTPFDHFIRSADSLPPFEPVSHIGQQESSLSVYRTLFEASVPPRKLSYRQDNVRFLQRLGKLPPWLRRHALSASFVQDIVHEETIQAPRVALILLNGIILGLLLTMFRFQMDQYSSSFDSSMYKGITYGLATFVLVYDIVFAHASIKTSVFVSQCLFNLFFLVDFAGALLAIVTTASMESQGNDISSLGATTTCLLWMSVIGYFTRWWHGMAMFVSGASRLWRMLCWPLIACAALIVAFAQMFYTLNVTPGQQDCETILGGRALCNVRDSYTTVYLMLLGTPLVDANDPEREELSNGTILMLSAFTFLLVLLIIDLVINIVMEAKMLDRGTAAIVNYWESQLTFVFLTDGFKQCFPLSRDDTSSKKQRKCWRTGSSSFADDLSVSSLQQSWKMCISTIFGTGQFPGESFRPRSDNRVYNAFIAGLLRIVALVILPIWMVVGLATLGILWPPQVREWLFKISSSGRKDPSELAYSAHQLAAIRNDLLQIKTMSYEKARSTEQHVWELRQLILAGVDGDRC